ncbi:hypothetical protein ACQZV8_09260 [Magnetococcales bacterium HHB-1]
MRRVRPRHSSLTGVARRVVKILKKEGWIVHPGRIDPKGGRGGQTRIKLTAESNRTRIRVAGGGVQEMFLYGDVVLSDLVRVLEKAFDKKSIESIEDYRK